MRAQGSDGVTTRHGHYAPGLTNHKSRFWSNDLSKEVRVLLDGHAPTAGQKEPGSFADFPVYRTFEQNPPYVIDLSIAQVNPLWGLTEWVVRHPDTVGDVRKVMPFLPAPRVP